MTADDRIDRVLLAVRMIPPGRVATYGDIGRVVGSGPRYVGNVLRLHADQVPWWRVLSASGVSPVLERARSHWEAEGIRVRRDGRGCRIVDYRADPHQLAADFASSAGQPGGVGVEGEASSEEVTHQVRRVP
ncbi:MAG: MGMT family protein [Propioniciclava sp.]